MGGKLDAVNVDGQTALHLASMSGHIETVKWLVANRANLRARDSSLRYSTLLFSLGRAKMRCFCFEILFANTTFDDGTIVIESLPRGPMADVASTTHYARASSGRTVQ